MYLHIILEFISAYDNNFINMQSFKKCCEYKADKNDVYDNERKMRHLFSMVKCRL